MHIVSLFRSVKPVSHKDGALQRCFLSKVGFNKKQQRRQKNPNPSTAKLKRERDAICRHTTCITAIVLSCDVQLAQRY